MEQGKKGSLQQVRDPIERIQIGFQTRYKDLENGFKLLLSKQSFVVEAAFVTATSAAKFFAIGCFATLTVGPTLVMNTSFNLQTQTMNPLQRVRVSKKACNII